MCELISIDKINCIEKIFIIKPNGLKHSDEEMKKT